MFNKYICHSAEHIQSINTVCVSSLSTMFSSAKRKKKTTCPVPVGKTASRVTTPGTFDDDPDSSSSGDEDPIAEPGTSNLK